MSCSDVYSMSPVPLGIAWQEASPVFAATCWGFMQDMQLHLPGTGGSKAGFWRATEYNMCCAVFGQVI